MIKSRYAIILIFFLSCTLTKQNTERKYYAGGYSLNFSFDSITHEYHLQSSDAAVDAIIPQFESVLLKENLLFLNGSVLRPRIYKFDKILKVDSVNVLYAYEKGKSGRLILIDTLGISNSEGAINLQIANPKKLFYLLFMKDSLISCAQIINSKLIKKK